MKKFTLFTIVLMMTSLANADWIPMVWDVDYEASSEILPSASDPAWTASTTPEASFVGDPAVLRFDTSYIYYSLANGGNEDVVTLESKFRLLSDTDTGYQYQLLMVRGRVSGDPLLYRLYFTTDSIWDKNSQEASVALGTDWHTVRWVMDANAKTNAVYLDGSDTPIITSLDFDSKSSYTLSTVFGRGSTTGEGAGVDVEYIRWSNSSTPLPEPATMSLVSLGAIVGLIRRKR